MRLQHLIIAVLLFCLPTSGWAGYDFDGTDDCITGTASSLPGSAWAPLSIFIVAKMDATTDGQYLVALKDSAGQAWLLYTTGTGKIASIMPFSVGSNAPFCVNTTSNTFSANDVIRYAVSYAPGGNCAAATHVANLNGTETSGSSFAYTTTGGGDKLAIGAGNATTCSGFLNGKVYEVAVWNVALTSNEMSQLVNGYSKRMSYRVRPASLKGYWELNETADSAAANGASVFDGVNAQTLTASDGANNTGMTGDAERVLSYP